MMWVELGIASARNVDTYPDRLSEVVGVPAQLNLVESQGANQGKPRLDCPRPTQLKNKTNLVPVKHAGSINVPEVIRGIDVAVNQAEM